MSLPPTSGSGRLWPGGSPQRKRKSTKNKNTSILKHTARSYYSAQPVGPGLPLRWRRSPLRWCRRKSCLIKEIIHYTIRTFVKSKVAHLPVAPPSMWVGPNEKRDLWTESQGKNLQHPEKKNPKYYNSLQYYIF